MKTNIPTTIVSLVAALAFGATTSFAQNQQGGQSGDENTTTDGWRGFLSIDYKGGRFVMPYSRIVSISQHDYLVDGGGRVYELTIDTTGAVVARFYFLESNLENSPFKAGQIINNRLKETEKMIQGKTGESARSVIKHYPDTTHAKMVEFNVSNKSHLGTIFGHVTHEWIEEGGRGAGRTLKFP